MYWCVYVILALRSQRQKDCCKFEASVVNRKTKNKNGWSELRPDDLILCLIVTFTVPNLKRRGVELGMPSVLSLSGHSRKMDQDQWPLDCHTRPTAVVPA